MPDRPASRDNGRVRAQPERQRRVNSREAKSSGVEGAPQISAFGLGTDYSQRTFEHHAAVLDSMSHSMYAQQRAAIARQLQRDYGNRYVQRLVNHIKAQRAKAAEGNKQEAESPGVVGHSQPGQAPTQKPELMMKPEPASPELEAIPNQDQAVPPTVDPGTQQLSRIQRLITDVDEAEEMFNPMWPRIEKEWDGEEIQSTKNAVWALQQSDKEITVRNYEDLITGIVMGKYAAQLGEAAAQMEEEKAGRPSEEEEKAETYETPG